MPGIEDLPGLISRLEKVAIRLETSTKAQTFVASAPSKDNAESLSAAVLAFDAVVTGPLKIFIEKSTTIGNAEVKTIAGMVEKAFSAQRDFLIIASKASQPSDSDLPALLKDTAKCIEEIQTFREKNRRSDYFNHLSGVSESISALGWVTVSPAPAPYILEMNNAGQFFTNRVLKDWKEKSRVHVEWVKAWIETLAELQLFVKEHHTTGVVWNKAGGNALQVAKSDLTLPSPPAGPAGPPPPPPPPPPAPPATEAPKATPDARAELMESLNQGEDLTKRLKAVSDDQKTHKNPELRNKSMVPGGAGKKMEVASTKPPVIELDGKKWNIENVNGRPDVVVETEGNNQSVYIYKCNGSTFQIKGKCNNIIMDGCKKSAILFESVVSSCEFINCQSIQMQVTGFVPTISVDKTDGCQMFLSKESLNVQLVTAKSSEMNIVVPEGDDFVEHPIPEQFVTSFTGGKLSTCPMTHEMKWD